MNNYFHDIVYFYHQSQSNKLTEGEDVVTYTCFKCSPMCSHLVYTAPWTTDIKKWILIRLVQNELYIVFACLHVIPQEFNVVYLETKYQTWSHKVYLQEAQGTYN